MIAIIQNFMERNIKSIPHFFTKNESFYISQYNYALIGKLSASLIHDILTPISSLYLTTNLSKENNKALEPMILNSTNQIQEFVEIMKDFLNHSKCDEPVHVNQEILKCIKLLTHKAHTHGVQIQFIEFDQIYNKINPLFIYQIIINLLSNAIDASAESEVKKVIIILKKDDQNFYIECKDFGHGIDSTTLGEICKARFTTKSDGCGLGLFSVKHILDTYISGQLIINSEPHNGSLFICKIPLQIK